MESIVFKLLDIALNGTLSAWSEARKRKRTFVKLKREVLFVGLEHLLPQKLHALRNFMLENDLVERGAFKSFFEKWLTYPLVVEGQIANNAFTRTEIDELHNERKELSL